MTKLKARDPQTLFRKIYKTETGKDYSYGSITQADKHAMQKKYSFSKEGNHHVAVLKEDAVAVNNAGSGVIQGIGTGKYPESEPGVPKKRLKVILKNARMLTRKRPNA